MGNPREVERLARQSDVRGLSQALRHRNAAVRRSAARALGELGNAASVLPLRRALKDSDPYVRQQAIEALRKIGNEEAVEVLAEAAFSRQADIAALSAQALANLETPQAQAAHRLRDILARSAFGEIEALGETAQRPLAAVLRSEQFATWPSAKRRAVLATAVRMGVRPPTALAAELAEMGLYVGGLHTVGDLLRGLHHRNPAVRIAAAEKLAAGNWRWAIWLLRWRFRHERSPKGDLRVATTLARLLDHLGDPRGVLYYRAQLDKTEDHCAAQALAEIGTAGAIEALFNFAASGARYGLAIHALKSVGPSAVDILRPLMAHESAHTRRVMVDIIANSAHPAKVQLLAELCRDIASEVQQAAFGALAALNSAEAAQALDKLASEQPQGPAVYALAAITHPAGPRYLRRHAPHATTLFGVLHDSNCQPPPQAYVQVLREHPEDSASGGGWQAATPRAESDSEGHFALALLELSGSARLRLKVTLPPTHSGQPTRTFEADLSLAIGQANYVQVRIDRLFERLDVTVEAEPPATRR